MEHNEFISSRELSDKFYQKCCSLSESLAFMQIIDNKIRIENCVQRFSTPPGW